MDLKQSDQKLQSQLGSTFSTESLSPMVTLSPPRSQSQQKLLSTSRSPAPTGLLSPKGSPSRSLKRSPPVPQSQFRIESVSLSGSPLQPLPVPSPTRSPSLPKAWSPPLSDPDFANAVLPHSYNECKDQTYTSTSISGDSDSDRNYPCSSGIQSIENP